MSDFNNELVESLNEAIEATKGTGKCRKRVYVKTDEPNETTYAAMEEAETSKVYGPFDSFDDAKKVLEDFYHKPYKELRDMADSGKIEQDEELD